MNNSRKKGEDTEITPAEERAMKQIRKEKRCLGQGEAAERGIARDSYPGRRES